MNGLPYYKRYSRDFMEGTIGMPLELKGAYSLVLDLIYMQDGKLPDDARYISGHLGCTVRKWNSLRQQLLDCDKITVNGEFLTNYRADKLLETSRKFQENQAEKGRKSNKNNKIDGTTVKPFARSNTEPDTDKKGKPFLSAQARAKKGGFVKVRNAKDAAEAFIQRRGLDDGQDRDETGDAAVSADVPRVAGVKAAN